MLLRNKTLLVIGVTFAIVILTSSMLSQFVLLSHFSALEQENTQHSVAQGVTLLKNEMDGLDAVNTDWATWDDTYQFIVDGNSEYINSNLVDKTFIDSQLNVLLFLDLTGRVVYGKAFDLNQSAPVSVPQSLLDQLSPDGALVHHTRVDSKVVGILMLSEGPMMISSRPITTSDNRGPIRGVVIMGRYLDAAYVSLLSQLAHLSIEIRAVDDSHLPSDFQGALAALSQYDIVVAPLSKTRIAGYAMIRDIYNKPAFVIRVDLPRDVYNQGLTSAIALIAAVAVAGLSSGAVAVWFINGQVLLPVSKLIADIDEIGESGEAEKRLSPPEGAHEFAVLASTINATLDALKRSEQSYRALFTSVPVGVYRSSLDGRLLTANPALVGMFGYSSEPDLLAADIKRDLYVVPGDREQMLQELACKGELRNAELRLKRKDGRELIVLDNSHAIRDEHGDVQFYEGTLTDITERKEMDEELRMYSKQLEHLVEERTKKLEAARRLAAIGEVAGMVGHDIRNPLTGIKTATYYLKKALAQKLNRKEQEMLGIIDKGVEQADKIVNDLLEYSRELRLKMKESSPRSALNEALAAAAIPAQIRVDNLVKDEPVATLDVDQMKRVYINLIKNAVEAMPEGGTLTIESFESNGNLTINFTDTGTGMPEEVMARLWTHLFTTKAKGMGFGLPICRRIVEAHGGTIVVKTQATKGSTFTVTVPIKPAPKQGIQAKEVIENEICGR